MLWLALMASASVLYDKGDWSSLWWLPTPQLSPVIGTQVAINDGKRLPHLMFVPPGQAPAEGWPLMIFLHGQGESSGGSWGSGLPYVALQGPPQHAGRHPAAMPFAVLSPQKPIESQFFDQDVAASIMALVDQYLGSLPLDRSRVYLTGLSQGGIGTWGLASLEEYAHRFAAIAPVCGGLPYRNKQHAAKRLADMPVWAFHGANDSILPVEMSDESIAALRATSRTEYAGAPKLTRFDARGSDYAWGAAGVPHMEGHASWVEAYYPPGTRVGGESALPPLYAWLLEHRRGDGNAAAGKGQAQGGGGKGTKAKSTEL